MLPQLFQQCKQPHFALDPPTAGEQSAALRAALHLPWLRALRGHEPGILVATPAPAEKGR